MKISVNLWSILGWRISLKRYLEAVELACKSGAEGVELVYDDSNIHPSKVVEKYPEIVRICDDYGCEISSIATGVFWRYNLGLRDKEGYKLLVEGLKMGEKFGAETLLILPAVATPEESYRKIYRNAVSILRRASKEAKKRGVKIGVENVWNKFLYSPMEFKNFLKEVGARNVGAYLDLGNLVMLGYHRHWIEELRGRIFITHAKDFKIEGDRFLFCHIGYGKIDWKEVIKLLRENKYDGYIVLETVPDFHPAEKNIKVPEESMKYIKGNVKRMKKYIS
ncbi:hypothetical protein B6U74_02970 [Candidatus Bathyarchaeota archaeon ex4484_205]|nr:MAG: hypothetical protein B6U74_02970 [Candidatus Bathyarchaeota archaeon ex4484_205]RLG66501.1 MAG: hypothetical protein DRN93_06205 [archaeon]